MSRDPESLLNSLGKITQKAATGEPFEGQPSPPLQPQPTWECRDHGHILPQNEACPEPGCGKQLLLG